MYNYMIGSRIKELRKSRKLTQSLLAQRLGVTKSVISAYENSTAYPSYDILISISRIFGVSTDYILGIEKVRSINVDGLNDIQFEIISSLVSELKRLNECKGEKK